MQVLNNHWGCLLHLLLANTLLELDTFSQAPSCFLSSGPMTLVAGPTPQAHFANSAPWILEQNQIGKHLSVGRYLQQHLIQLSDHVRPDQKLKAC